MSNDFEKREGNLYQMLPDIRNSIGKNAQERLRMIHEDILRFWKKEFADSQPDKELILELEFLMYCLADESTPPPGWLTYDRIKEKFQDWINYRKESNFGNGPFEEGPENK